MQLCLPGGHMFAVVICILRAMDEGGDENNTYCPCVHASRPSSTNIVNEYNKQPLFAAWCPSTTHHRYHNRTITHINAW